MKCARWFVFVVAMLSAAALFAAQGDFTGYDYLGLSKPQRVNTVKMFKEEASKQGTIISKDPIFYCKKLDAFYAKHPKMVNESFVKTLKTLMIMEYDWSEKGTDRDSLARQWLGDDLYKANKARLGKK
jgi:hypothetical protein